MTFVFAKLKEMVSNRRFQNQHVFKLSAKYSIISVYR